MKIPMKLGLFFLIVILSNWVLSFGYASTEIVVEMTQESYTPRDLEIKKGDTIIFKNIGTEDNWPASNIHPTHEIYPEFDPHKPIFPGNSWQFKFNKSGVWKYHDHLYPQMTGTIKVTNTSEPESSPDATSKNIFSRLGQFIKKVLTAIIGVFNEKSDAVDIDIQENSEDIFNNQEFLRSYVKKFGPAETIKKLNELSSKFGSCHDSAHKAGHFAYEIFGEKSFKECSAECHSGCYHGTTEAYFKEHGTENLSKNLNTLCGNELNGFFSHQCIHGIGHGLMAWTNYEIDEALKDCDLLPERQDSCWTGVFMENTVGSLTQGSGGEIGGHFTKYISDDPLYPCTIVEDKYKSSCYFLQTSRMIQIFGVDFEKVTSSCLDAPKPYQKSCFGSMGRDVGGVYRKDPAEAIKACSFAPNKEQLRNECLMGAVQDSFWDPSGQDEAIQFCRLLTNPEEKSSCYRTIFERAPQVLLSKNELNDFCKKVEDGYKNICPN